MNGPQIPAWHDTALATTFRLFELLFPSVPAGFPDHAARGAIATSS